jgi:predicted phosphodiesterase
MKTVMAIGDMHFPYTDEDKLEKLYVQIRKEKPDVVVQLGDLYDQYNNSRYDRDLNLVSPKEERVLARAMGELFWETVQTIVPDAECYQLLGNHDIRMLKNTGRKNPEILDIIQETHQAMYSFKGVTTVGNSDRDFLVIDGVVYCHGWQARHTAHFFEYGKVIRAHDHKVWERRERSIKTGRRVVFEYSCGTFADASSIPLSYTASMLTNWEAGYTIVKGENVRQEVI